MYIYTLHMHMYMYMYLYSTKTYARTTKQQTYTCVHGRTYTNIPSKTKCMWNRHLYNLSHRCSTMAHVDPVCIRSVPGRPGALRQQISHQRRTGRLAGHGVYPKPQTQSRWLTAKVRQLRLSSCAVFKISGPLVCSARLWYRVQV